MSLFSIIMPAYNRDSLICEALDSVRAQTYRPIEIIVVDDGSTDGTASAVRHWAAEACGLSGVRGQTSEAGDVTSAVSGQKSAVSPDTLTSNNLTRNTELESRAWELGDDQLNVRYFYQENAGAGAARNRGIQEIRGTYVQFLDSDDRIHPGRLQRLADTFEKETCDFIQTGFEGFDADTGEVISTHYGRLKDDLVSQALMGVLWANTLRSAYSAELVRKTGLWNTEMTCFEDYDYVIRALLNARKPVAIRDILASARRGGGVRISDRLKTYEGRWFRIHCEEQVGKLLLNPSDAISRDAKLIYVSRIFCLAVRTYASGWNDLGQQCGGIVLRLDPDTASLRYKSAWYYLWLTGPLGGFIYRCFRSV